MSQQFSALRTPLGHINGRDGIFLDQVVFRGDTSTLVLVASLNASLCSDAKGNVIDFVGCKFAFTGVLALKMVELDSWDGRCESCFDEVLDSQWVKELGGKVTPFHRHLLIQTYDDVIEVVCQDFSVELAQEGIE